MQKYPWRIASASAIGTSHLSNGSSCEDSFAYSFAKLDEDEEILIAAVSDGAGSAEHSAAASRLTCDSFIERIESHLRSGGKIAHLDKTFATNLITEISNVLQEKAKLNGHRVRDYACTLLGVIVGESSSAFLQIGDGAIVTSGGFEDGWSWVFWPQHGEFANATNFVISEDAQNVADFEVASRRVDEFAIFSDGIENLVLHQATKTVHGPFFESMFGPVRTSKSIGLDETLSKGLEKYLSSPTICERTDDDKTLLLASRRSISHSVERENSTPIVPRSISDENA